MEYHFQVTNLAVDLADGACLARLVEQLTGINNLVARLTLPVVSDIQVRFVYV